MARVLLIGSDPPPLATQMRIEAAHYRTWQFLEPTLAAGHTVALCAGDLVDSPGSVSIPERWATQLEYHRIPFGRRGWRTQLQRVHDHFRPDSVVAVNFSHSLYASRLHTQKPVWMDIYGDYLTIVQAAAYRAQSDRGLATSIAFVKDVLRAGDSFSVCGEPQRHALVGELAMAGRLNRHTFGYEFVHVVRPGVPGGFIERATRRRVVLARRDITDGDFVVLWCGGYNTWTDVETLFAGIEGSMAHDDRIQFVSVGASTYEAPDNVYDRFVGLVERSRYRSRFHLLGWRPWSELASYYAESDVGLNVDSIHYETTYGTRTRLVEMVAAGLPVITSLGCELSTLLEREKAALTFVPRDALALTDRILTVAKDERARTKLIKQAADCAHRELSFDATTAELRAWLKAPQRAPDRSRGDPRQRTAALTHRARTLCRRLLWHVAGLDR